MSVLRACHCHVARIYVMSTSGSLQILIPIVVNSAVLPTYAMLMLNKYIFVFLPTVSLTTIICEFWLNMSCNVALAHYVTTVTQQTYRQVNFGNLITPAQFSPSICIILSRFLSSILSNSEHLCVCIGQ